MMGEIAKITITFVLGFCAAVFAEPIRRRLFRSAISLKFEPKIGFGRQCVSLTSTTQADVMAKYVRVLATCSSRIGVTARACQPFLTRIERVAPHYCELHHDPIPLNWAYIGHQALDIHPQMAFYFDIVAVNSAENILRPQTTVDPMTWPTLLSQPGRYRFSVTLSGENIKRVPDSQSPMIEFEWGGSFDSLTEDCF
ncbi:MAG: hypothetical protein HQ582_33760 [Planctomycetes bacterium]|nr:hypothetical protein [Planctomycetota bacterium]